MEIITPKSTSYVAQIKKYIEDRPWVTDVYLYKIDKEMFLDLSVSCHDCSSQLAKTVSQLSGKHVHSRFFVGCLNNEDIIFCKKHYLSAFFFEACFILSLDWNCYFINWSPIFSMKQHDKKGPFRNASLNSDLPAYFTLTIPDPTSQKEALFIIKKPFDHLLSLKGAQKSPCSWTRHKTEAVYSISLQPSVYQYCIKITMRKYLQFFKKKSRFTLRGIESKYSGTNKERSALDSLKKMHGLGYMSLTSFFSYNRHFFCLDTRFSYFEQGFQVKSISEEEDSTHSNLSIIFANKSPYTEGEKK